jgi:hypothetical protein
LLLLPSLAAPIIYFAIAIAIAIAIRFTIGTGFSIASWFGMLI